MLTLTAQAATYETVTTPRVCQKTKISENLKATKIVEIKILVSMAPAKDYCGHCVSRIGRVGHKLKWITRGIKRLQYSNYRMACRYIFATKLVQFFLNALTQNNKERIEMLRAQREIFLVDFCTPCWH